MSSRVASDEAAIAQLRALLKHAGDVSSLLSVQNQINSEESDLESMLAQQNALNHETALRDGDAHPRRAEGRRQARRRRQRRRPAWPAGSPAAGTRSG